MPKISACIVAYCDYDEVCAAMRSVLANTPGDLPCMWWITPALTAAAPAWRRQILAMYACR